MVDKTGCRLLVVDDDQDLLDMLKDKNGSMEPGQAVNITIYDENNYIIVGYYGDGTDSL